MSNYVEARRRPFGGDARNDRAGLTLAGNPAEGLERAAYYTLLAFVALLPFSIAASQVLLTDRPMAVCVGLYLTTVLLILYRVW